MHLLFVFVYSVGKSDADGLLLQWFPVHTNATVAVVFEKCSIRLRLWKLGANEAFTEEECWWKTPGIQKQMWRTKASYFTVSWSLVLFMSVDDLFPLQMLLLFGLLFHLVQLWIVWHLLLAFCKHFFTVFSPELLNCGSKEHSRSWSWIWNSARTLLG